MKEKQLALFTAVDLYTIPEEVNTESLEKMRLELDKYYQESLKEVDVDEQIAWELAKR